MKSPTCRMALIVVVGCSISPLARAQSVVFHGYGVEENEEYGAAVDGLGDVNGDGHDDLVVGARSAGSEAGRAEVLSGADGSVLHAWVGAGVDGLGTSVAGPGDVDGDGVPDVLVGAFRYPAGGGSGLFGKVTLFSGASGGELAAFVGGPTDEYGKSVSGAGDVDLDGVPDLLLGGSNLAKVYSGASGEELHSWSGCDNTFGRSVSDAGDADGDGWPDLAVTANGGGACGLSSLDVFSGRTGLSLLSFSGTTISTSLPQRVASAGDVNGDGHDDLLIGSGKTGLCPTTGNVFVVSGADGSPIHVVHAEGTCGWGYSVDSLGDVDFDNVPDFAFGVTDPFASGGTVYAHSGATGSLLWSFVNPGTAASDADQVGAVLARAGDVDADGRPDLVVGAYLDENPAGQTTGSIYVLTSCAGDLDSYGQGLAGSGGLVPQLSGLGCPLPSTTVTFSVTDAVPASPLFLGYGTAPAAIPIFGGVLLVNPLAGVMLTSDLGGSASFAVPLSTSPSLSGVQVFLQGFVLDVRAPQGIAMTPGLKLLIG